MVANCFNSLRLLSSSDWKVYFEQTSRVEQILRTDTAGLYAISGFILPLDGQFDFTRYNKPVVEAITLDGHSWGVPVSNGNHLMMFYNKKLVKAPPKTTDELFAFCGGPAKQLKLEYCLAFDMGEPFWMMPWLF